MSKTQEMKNIRTTPIVSFCTRNPILSMVIMAAIGWGGCTQQPSDEQLELWRKQAIARNAAIAAEQVKTHQQSEWNLVIQGETTTGKTVQMNWQQLEALATTHIKTTDANNVIRPHQVFDFRGVPVSLLLKKFGYQPHVTEVTFIAYNSYQVTVNLQDLIKYPIILAIANNGKPISRNQGGPIYLVFPQTQYPQLQQPYPESYWVFYVSNMIVGTESARLKVGRRELNLTDLEKLPQVTITQTVGYRSGWPSSNVKLHGVRIRDIFNFAQVKLLNSGEVLVQSKQKTYQNRINPVKLTAATIQNCDILVATKWGESQQPIPAKMGGPLTLAFGSDCQAQTQGLQWLTFVEELVTNP